MILSVPFCPYHFVPYHFVLGPVGGTTQERGHSLPPGTPHKKLRFAWKWYGQTGLRVPPPIEQRERLIRINEDTIQYNTQHRLPKVSQVSRSEARPESHFALELWLDSENYLTWLHLRDLTWLPTFVTWGHDFCMVLFNKCMGSWALHACLYRPRGVHSLSAYEAFPIFQNNMFKKV